jgi:two-component system cell cycle sensor histidine kinase PleC
MLSGSLNRKSNGSLMGEYSSLLGDAILRQRAREAETAAQIETNLANKIKSEFISNMSHELRTPLNTVIGFAKILSEHDRRKLPAHEIVEYAQLIQDAASHLLSVINDILDISKMQSGRYSLESQDISVEEILGTCVTSIKKPVEDAGLTLHVNIQADLPPIKGDAAKLRQAFANILSNAVKFTHRGGEIFVDAMRLSDGGNIVIIRDTGVGMTKNEIDVAVTPFGQVDGSRTRWREGTGLGLPIAKALVELHGGEIEVRSEKGVGTEIALKFPPRHFVAVSEGLQNLLGNGVM